MENKLYKLTIRAIFQGNRFLKATWIFMVASLLTFSCEEEEIQTQVIERIPTLSVSDTDLALDQQLSNRPAVTFTWSAGSNYGTNKAIDYALQLDKKGNNFSSPVTLELGRGLYSKALTVGELNTILLEQLGLGPGSAYEIEARLKSSVAADEVEEDISNTTTLAVTPFEPVTSTLYMIGSATPNGWSADEPTALKVNADNPTVFSAQVQLVPGEFKFITTEGQFLPAYAKGADENSLLYRTDDAQPDENFSIEEGGSYIVSVNLAELIISLEKQAGPAYNKLWIVGEAMPNGWDIDNAAEMTQNANDPFIFTFNEILKEGEFKIATARDWATPFYRPTVADAPVTHTEVQLSAGDPDTKWVIDEPGAYKISLNLRDLSISIVPFEPYAQLWMVGNATPAGWDIDNPTEMEADPNDPFVFTYTGPLTEGEFKIPTATGDWNADYFMPVTNHQDISETDVAFIPKGNPDNKWEIKEVGNYTVTLNQLYHTISITKN